MDSPAAIVTDAVTALMISIDSRWGLTNISLTIAECGGMSCIFDSSQGGSVRRDARSQSDQGFLVPAPAVQRRVDR